jgi:hypothetical protein
MIIGIGPKQIGDEAKRLLDFGKCGGWIDGVLGSH